MPAAPIVVIKGELTVAATDVAPTPTQVTGEPSIGSDPGWRDRTSMNRTAQWVCIVCGPVMILSFVIGSVWLARLFPPAIHANWTSAEVVQWFSDHGDKKYMIGMVFTTFAYSVMATWGVGMATQTRRKEGAFPTWTYLQLVNMAAGTACIVVMGAIFALCAYRPGEIDPDITRTLYDLGWFLLLGTWMCFTFWSIALGMQILTDKSPNPVFPRWSGYISVAAGLGYTFGSGCWFAMTGAFSWNGAIALWFVFLEFGGWVLLFTYLTWRNMKSGYVGEQDLRQS